MKALETIIRGTIKQILPGHLPDFLVVGAQKAGTTSLYYYLSQHPNIVASRPKEIRFFDRDENYERGLVWYKHNFPNLKGLSGNYKYFEATPEYLYRSYVPQRIFNFDKNIKIVVVLRDPVQRAYSAWNTYLQFSKRSRLPETMYTGYLKGKENNILKEFYHPSEFPSFEKAIDDDILRYHNNDPNEEPAIVRRGIYSSQVKRYLNLFGKENVLILGFKDVVGENKADTLNSILKFVGIKSSEWNFLNDDVRNKSRNKETIPRHVEERLKVFFADHNSKLFDLIGFIPNW